MFVGMVTCVVCKKTGVAKSTIVDGTEYVSPPLDWFVMIDRADTGEDTFLCYTCVQVGAR